MYSHLISADGKVSLDRDDLVGTGPETSTIQADAPDGTYSFEAKNLRAGNTYIKVFYNRTNNGGGSGFITATSSAGSGNWTNAVTIVKSGTSLVINGQ